MRAGFRAACDFGSMICATRSSPSWPMGVAAHVLKSISDHLSRRMLEHDSHMRKVAADLTSQSHHSLLLQGSQGSLPSGKLLIPLARRDVRVVETAGLESVILLIVTRATHHAAGRQSCGHAVERDLDYGRDAVQSGTSFAAITGEDE